MEPPSPLISWVNPFPSRFINRTACSREKCHISVSLVCHREKKMKLDEVELRSPSLDRFPFLLYVHFYNSTAAGIWVSWNKVNELPDWDWAWSDGTKAVNWGSRKGYLCECFFCFVFFFALMNPTFKHAPWKESTIKRSVDDLELFDDQRRKGPGSFDFCHHRGVDFAS